MVIQQTTTEATTFQLIIVIMLIIMMAFATAWLYRKIVSGITIRQEERKATKVGRFGGKATERIERRD